MKRPDYPFAPSTSHPSSNAKVYDSYDASSPPPHPGPRWTRFVCISDTHSRTSYPLPPGDVLLHAGDLSSHGRPSHLTKTLEWLLEQPHAEKVIIAGNHDHSLDQTNMPRHGKHKQKNRIFLDVTDAQLDDLYDMVKGERAREAHIHYLEHESLELKLDNGKTWKLYGSPAAPMYAWGSFQYVDDEEARAIYNPIPPDTSILLTHTPPQSIRDLSSSGARAGCPILSKRLKDLKQCRLHVFGHIHESHGYEMHGVGEYERVSVNGAMAYGGQAIIVDLKNEIGDEVADEDKSGVEGAILGITGMTLK
ncbi:unnamed protein product [Peniophora sp. CBMAI 1063]|nr:unnamed protein product [Peniophora sp. CBMAI 1063]